MFSFPFQGKILALKFFLMCNIKPGVHKSQAPGRSADYIFYSGA